MSVEFVRVTQGGRMILPAKIRQLLGLKVGSNVAVEVRGENVILTNAQFRRKKAQERIMRAIPRKVSLVGELLEERRAEAARE